MKARRFALCRGDEYLRLDSAKTVLPIEHPLQSFKEKHPNGPKLRSPKPLSHKRNDVIALTIHKMDNTSFAVEVAKDASISKLKRTIEKKFDGCGLQISWPHVWGHFCLTFKNEKLLDDKKKLHRLGICDSDELRFVRQTTMSPADCIKQQRQHGFFAGLMKSKDPLK